MKPKTIKQLQEEIEKEKKFEEEVCHMTYQAEVLEATLKQTELIKKAVGEIVDWILKEVSKQPTDKSIQHLKSQITAYIIPEAKTKLQEVFE